MWCFFPWKLDELKVWENNSWDCPIGQVESQYTINTSTVHAGSSGFNSQLKQNIVVNDEYILLKVHN